MRLIGFLLHAYEQSVGSVVHLPLVT